MPRPKANSSAKSRGSLGPGSFGRDATIDDIPRDEIDAFEAGRDSVLLDSGDARREADDMEELGGNHERQVLNVDDAGEHSDDSDENGEEEEDYDDEFEYDAAASTGRRTLVKPAAPVVSDDDSEDYDDDDDDDEGGQDEDDVHINDRGWGSNKRAYYNTNNLDEIDSDSEMDEEEARELELKEVKRLQRKSRSAMDDADFGLGDDEVEGSLGKALRDAGREKRRQEFDAFEAATQPPTASFVSNGANAAAAPTTPATQSTDAGSRQALLAKLQRISPETVALAGEYADMVEEFGKVDATLKKMVAEKPDNPSLELIHLHHQILITYLTTIAFYFHLRASPEYAADPSKLSSHPVLTRLMKLKQGLSVMEDLGLTAAGGSQPSSIDAANAELAGDLEMFHDASGDEDEELGSLEDDELADLMADEKENAAPKAAANGKDASKRTKGKKSKEVGEESAKAKKAKKGDVIAKKKAKSAKEAAPTPLAADLAELDNEPVPDFKIKANKKAKAAAAAPNPFVMSQHGDDAEASTSFGEPTQLAMFESAERDAKRRSLQFHASAVETKGSQRNKAAKDRLAGDMDIPYRDRERSRMAVEAAKAARQQRELPGKQNTSLDDEGWGETDDRDWRDVMGVEAGGRNLSSANGDDAGSDGDEDYYDLIASGKKASKRAKKEAYDAMRDEERFVPDETLEPGQHRGINRAIEKNKGLAPHRKKSARNPRVKKREKYEQAKKKLSSRQAVFKGGQASLQGGYGGEQSGISSHLVRSRKLG